MCGRYEHGSLRCKVHNTFLDFFVDEESCFHLRRSASADFLKQKEPETCRCLSFDERSVPSEASSISQSQFPQLAFARDTVQLRQGNPVFGNSDFLISNDADHTTQEIPDQGSLAWLQSRCGESLPPAHVGDSVEFSDTVAGHCGTSKITTNKNHVGALSQASSMVLMPVENSYDRWLYEVTDVPSTDTGLTDDTTDSWRNDSDEPSCREMTPNLAPLADLLVNDSLLQTLASSLAVMLKKTSTSPAPLVPQSGTTTTLMVRNIICRYSELDVFNILNAMGLQGKFDFMYCPTGSAPQCNFGYFFVNLKSSDYVQHFERALVNRQFGHRPTYKRCEVSRAELQGLELLYHLSCKRKQRGCSPKVRWCLEGQSQLIDVNLLLRRLDGSDRLKAR